MKNKEPKKKSTQINQVDFFLRRSRSIPRALRRIKGRRAIMSQLRWGGRGARRRSVLLIPSKRIPFFLFLTRRSRRHNFWIRRKGREGRKGGMKKRRT